MDTSEAKLGGYLFFPVSYSWYLMMFAKPEFSFLLSPYQRQINVLISYTCLKLQKRLYRKGICLLPEARDLRLSNHRCFIYSLVVIPSVQGKYFVLKL